MLPRFARSAYRFSPLIILIFTVQRLRRNKEADETSAPLLRSAHCTVKTDCTILSKLLQGFPPCTPRRSRKLIFLFCMFFCRQIFHIFSCSFLFRFFVCLLGVSGSPWQAKSDGNFSKKMPSLFYACYSIFFDNRGKKWKMQKNHEKTRFYCWKKEFYFLKKILLIFEK